MADRQERMVKSDEACFVCGPKNPIGLHAVFSTDKEHFTSHAELQLTADYQGWQDVIHGGILASLLDEACVYACMTKAQQCVTADLQIRYRKPVPVDSQVIISGQLVDSSRKIWQAAAQLKIADTLYAEATAKIFVLG